MIPTTYGGINKSRTGDSHSKAPEETVKSIRTSYQIQSARQSLCLSFFVFLSHGETKLGLFEKGVRAARMSLQLEKFYAS
jgi:hypothetical protein